MDRGEEIGLNVGEVAALETIPKISESNEKLTGTLYIRPSWIMLFISLSPLFAFVFVSHLSVQYFLSKQLYATLNLYSGAIRGFSLLLRIALVGELLRRYFDRLYTISYDKIIESRGQLSLRLKLSTINLRDLREVRIEQNVFGRLIGFGDLLLSTASTNEYEVKLEGIDSPNEVMTEINRRRKQCSSPRPSSS